MRRTRINRASARRSGAAFAVAALLALLVAMFPTAAFADAAPDQQMNPAPAAPVIPAASGESHAASDDVSSIPTPDNGDYVGSNTEDEANPGSYSASQPGYKPVSLQGFRAGNIISDAKMYTSGTLSAKQLQFFFDEKVPTCDSGYTCLKDFSMKTQSKSPNEFCSNSYEGSSNDTAAQIISKVSQACGVSEKVLVVMLQKEQGLVTHTWPSQFRYDIAMGYACPDDAACDERYFGFQNQMYMAAYQLQRYTQDSYFSWYSVGETSQVRWHPNASCGSSAVYIENQATAALYYYTPYQPNQAALDAGYGVGDECSAYGNRNFYNYYTDWFEGTRGGEPATPDAPKVPGEIGAKWRALGGESSSLGAPTAEQKCGLADDGCSQEFEGGIITWSKATGAHPLQNRTLAKWNDLGGVTGKLSYPTTDLRCGLAGGGCYQQFAGGKTYWNGHTSDVKAIWGASMKKYNAMGNENGRLGYPTGDRICGLVRGGCYQTFEGGNLYWQHDQPAYGVWGSAEAGYEKIGKERSRLGYPQSDPICSDDVCTQYFLGGGLTWESGSGEPGEPWYAYRPL
ncbi:MAG TPA: hypothetical protein H9769_08140 [Candidatus Microbacterium pullistercoris]|nr:hypothetical protein [Candidatus Microbacterium pullistercoris]